MPLWYNNDHRLWYQFVHAMVLIAMDVSLEVFVMTGFGDYVRGLREKHEIGLREFCVALEFDPSRWSKMERGLLQPPTDQEMLERIAVVLKISSDTEEFARLRDLAFLSRGQVPDDILSEKELVECLPMIFRTLRNDEKPTPAQLRKLADKLRHDQRKKVHSD